MWLYNGINSGLKTLTNLNRIGCIYASCGEIVGDNEVLAKYITNEEAERVLLHIAMATATARVYFLPRVEEVERELEKEKKAKEE